MFIERWEPLVVRPVTWTQVPMTIENSPQKLSDAKCIDRYFPPSEPLVAMENVVRWFVVLLRQENEYSNFNIIYDWVILGVAADQINPTKSRFHFWIDTQAAQRTHALAQSSGNCETLAKATYKKTQLLRLWYSREWRHRRNWLALILRILHFNPKMRLDFWQ